jgi:hypothetical protein
MRNAGRLDNSCSEQGIHTTQVQEIYQELMNSGRNAWVKADKPGVGGIVIPNPAKRVRNLLAERVFLKEARHGG